MRQPRLNATLNAVLGLQPGVAAGINAKALSTYMGHSSIAITFDPYGHLMPGYMDEAAGILDAYLARADTAARVGQLDTTA